MTPVEEIKSRLDIVEFIRGYVKLEKSGQNWRALCPFHAEKTPSFFVSPSRQSWHCFGACQTGGDIFSFFMKIENIEFPEAFRILAEKAGVEVRREDPKLRSERNRLHDLLEEATTFYEANLRNASLPMAYLEKERGLAPETIKEFRLGWAPDEWRLLLSFLAEKGFRPDEVERAGLAIQKPNGERYDRFRGRIMFPLFDAMGRVVGFTGRILVPANTTEEKPSDVAKYLNTPETPLFQKSKLLYGYHRAKSAIAKENAALLVEGQMDFLAAWQDGIRNVVATSGTALTALHLQALRRVADTLILGFDMDEAGSHATERGVLMAARMGFGVAIVTLPDGKDIADFVTRHPGKLGELLAAPKHLMEYYIEKGRARYPCTDLKGKTQFISYLMPRLKTLASPAERALWIREVAGIVGVNEASLMEELQRTPSLLELETIEAPEPMKKGIAPKKTRRELLAERALAFALGSSAAPPFFSEFVAYFPDRYRELAARLATNVSFDPSSDVVQYLGMRYDYERALNPDLDIQKELNVSLRELKREALKEKRAELTAALRDAERTNDETKTIHLLREIDWINQELRSA